MRHSKDVDLDEVLRTSQIVQELAEDMINNGVKTQDFECPYCSKKARVEVGQYGSVMAGCETPDCFYMHMDLKLNLEGNANGTH